MRREGNLLNPLRQSTSRGVLLTIGLLVLLAVPFSLPASAQTDEAAQVEPPVTMPQPDPRIAAIWDQTDGRLLRGETSGPFVWGEQPLAIVVDNSKLRALVPDYVATIPFHVGAREIVAWFDEDPSRQVVDERLDKVMDDLVARYRV